MKLTSRSRHSAPAALDPPSSPRLSKSYRVPMCVVEGGGAPEAANALDCSATPRRLARRPDGTVTSLTTQLSVVHTGCQYGFTPTSALGCATRELAAAFFATLVRDGDPKECANV